MKVIIYELLGLIKDGKAPKKIKDDATGHIYEYDAVWNDYKNEKDDYYIMDIARLAGWLEIKVEILDEEDEFIDIEEFCTSYSLDYIDYRNIEVLKEYLNKDLQNIFDILDKLIKNQKKIINKLKEEGK